MSVKKIFIVLITIVACVMVGAFVLNVLMPSAFKIGVNAVEDQIFRATGMKFDINSDGTFGSKSATSYKGVAGNGYGDKKGGNNVDGWAAGK